MKYAINGMEILDDLQMELYKYIGPAALYMNLDWILFRGVELMLNGKVLGDSKFLSRFMDEFKIPSDIKEELSMWFLSTLYNRLNNFIVDFSPIANSYDFYITSLGDIIIEDLGPNSPVLDIESLYKESLKTSMDNGDYIPEYLRRLVS
jgi:hypothetical protein